MEKFKRAGKMGVTKWEGVIVGYPTGSVGYRVWDPVRGKVFNVGVPDVDENVEAGWWRKAADGGEFDDVEPVRFPNLNDDVDAVGVATHQLEMPAFVEDNSDDEAKEEDDVHEGDGRDDS